MNWPLTILLVLKYLGFVLLIWMLPYDYKLQYISPEHQVDQHKEINKRRFNMMLLGIILGLGVSIFTDWDSLKKEKAEGAYRAEQENRQTAFAAQVARLEKQQAANLKEYDKILVALATNSTPNPALLSALAQAKEHFRVISTGVVDLKAWVSELKNKRDLIALRREQARLKTVDEEKVFMSPSLPVWDYTMKTFVTMINELAKRIGANLSSDFTNLPSIDILCQGPTGQRGPFDDLSFHVADISIRTNLAWHCRIIRKNDMLQYRSCRQPTLIIERRSTNGIETVQIYASGASLSLPDGLSIFEQLPASDYKKGVDAVLRGLIAAEAEEFGGAAK